MKFLIKLDKDIRWRVSDKNKWHICAHIQTVKVSRGN